MKKNFKITLMTGLFLTSLLTVSTSFAQSKDPNDAAVAGAQAVVPGQKCDVCAANTATAAMRQEDPHRYDGLLPDGSGTAADKAATDDKGTH